MAPTGNASFGKRRPERRKCLDVVTRTNATSSVPAVSNGELLTFHGCWTPPLTGYCWLPPTPGLFALPGLPPFGDLCLRLQHMNTQPTMKQNKIGQTTASAMIGPEVPEGEVGAVLPRVENDDVVVGVGVEKPGLVDVGVEWNAILTSVHFVVEVGIGQSQSWYVV